MLSRLILLALIVCMSACRSGEIACPEPKTAKLKKKVGVNYRVLMARRKAESKPMTKAELRQLQARNYKTVSVEEWDCPRPGGKKMPKHVQENIRKNKKKIDAYFKSRESLDSLSSPVTPKQ